MILHEDGQKSFIPSNEVKFVILGTMVAINARKIDGTPPVEEVFYYNNPRNHFWRVLQYLLNPQLGPDEKAPRLSIDEKKAFLEAQGIAIVNLVKSVTVPNKDKFDPSDTVLFQAQKKGRVTFKQLTPKAKKILLEKPLFFTCRKKRGIDLLLEGFKETNRLGENFLENIWYWPTPTRCNPYQRSLLWRKEMQQFLKDKNTPHHS